MESNAPDFLKNKFVRQINSSFLDSTLIHCLIKKYSFIFRVIHIK